MEKKQLIFNNIKPEDCVFGESLGEGTAHITLTFVLPLVGAFGNVKIGWLKANPGRKFAIKTMKKNDIIQSKHVDHIENEKNILELLNHPFTVSFPTHSHSE